MNISLSVVIPVYNEEKIAADTAAALTAYLTKRFPDGDYEIIFANDGSRDRTAELIGALTDDHIKLAGYPDNRGKGSAVREGVLAAAGSAVLYTDCDLAYGTEMIGTAYDTLISSGADLVIGSRNISADGYSGYTPLRKFMSKTYIKLISLIAGFRYSDSQCGIKCLKDEAAKSIFKLCTVNGFAFDLEMLIIADKKKLKITELPVKIINHRESESKVSPVKDTLKMIRDVMKIKKRCRNIK